jgi:UDP-N-acetylmuramate dehydrogenase
MFYMPDKNVQESLRRLCRRHGGSVKFNHSLSRYSTISIGGEALVWYAPSSLEELREVLIFLRDNSIRIKLMGAGSNILIPDNTVDAAVINLSSAFFKSIRFDKNEVTAGGGANLNNVIHNCCKNGLAGLEGLTGIPATVGGALVMNASYSTAISERLSRVLVIDFDGEIAWMNRKDIKFGYRYSSLQGKGIILEAVFVLKKSAPDELNDKLRSYFVDKFRKQPLDEKTLGCIFKNPVQTRHTSGELIDKSGLKSLQRGAAKISEKHANFIVNSGGAMYKDVIGLMESVKKEVYKHFSIELEPEIEIW